MLRNERRLRSARDFKRVYLEGNGVRGRFLGLRFTKGKGEKTRFGLAPARKIRSAVLRNRVKRRMREICRSYQNRIKERYDVVINIYGDAVGASYGELERDFVHVMRRAGLLEGGGKESAR